MTSAKANILSRLKRRKPKSNLDLNYSKRPPTEVPPFDVNLQLAPFIHTLKENHIEVHIVSDKNWKATFIDIMKRKGARHCLLGNTLEYQNDLAEDLAEHSPHLKITRFNKQYEELKEALFQDIDISLTLAQSAIADTGTLVIVPTENEPRMMSLIPPIHVVMLQAKQITANMQALLEKPPWEESGSLPSNILFVSSPSKTADIQQTLAYGAHGPKQLIVLIQN